jgi:hypothetical protein
MRASNFRLQRLIVLAVVMLAFVGIGICGFVGNTKQACDKNMIFDP